MLKLLRARVSRREAIVEPSLMRFGLWDRQDVPASWLWSEKLDGVRALHTTGTNTLKSRREGQLAVPEECMQSIEDFSRHLARELARGLPASGDAGIVIVLD
eukprot:Hpha_TRINITY_DN33306_c0_g1::TRINITY_DN33306_c0_g1_i1::g.186816::m.186816